MSSSTAAAATVAPVASNSGSRSRSGSSARFLSVNTQAASSEPVPNIPQMSGHNVLRTPDSIDGSTMSPAIQNSASSSSPASAIASSAVGSPTTNGTHGQPQQSRDHFPASALRPSGASKEPSRTREKEKTAGKALGRSRTENRDTTDEDDAEARILRMLLHDTEPAPPTLMYWSRAPVWGALPMHKMRSHTLLSLKEFYDDQRGKDESPNELEMRIYHRLGLIRDQHERNDRPPLFIAVDPASQLISHSRSEV
ncbi:SAC3_5 [Sanghuangporus weigelae]